MATTKSSSSKQPFRQSGMSHSDAQAVFSRLKSGVDAARDYKTYKEEEERRRQEYQNSLVDQTINPESYIDANGLENRQDLQDLQTNAYGQLDENLRNDLTELNKRNEVYDLTGIQNINPLDTQIADEDSGLQNLNPVNLVKNIKKAFDAKEAQKQSIVDEYGLRSTYDVEDLAKEGKAIDARNEFKAKATQQYGLQDGYYNQKKDTSRNYQQEINYANKYLSGLSDDTDAVRSAVTSYLDADDKANEAQAGASAEAMSGNTTAQDQATYLRYTADKKASDIMSRYGITDKKEFSKLVQYVQELNDYDESLARQEAAYQSVHTGNVGKNLANATVNTIQSAANLIPGAAGAVLGTIDYYANGYADKDAPLNVNSKAFAMQNDRDDYRAATQEAASEINPALGFGYGVASSVLDNVVTGAAGKLVGGVVGGTATRSAQLAGKSFEEAVEAAGGITAIAEQVGNLTPFFGSAFSSTLADRVESGDYMDVAVSKAIRDGSVETLTEIAPNASLYDIIRKGGKGGQTFAQTVVKNLAKQFKEEGLEEIEGDILTLFLDRAQYGNNSEFDQMVKNYINNGYSEKDAKDLAVVDELKQIAMDGLAGGLAGAVGGVGATAVGTIEARTNANNMFGDFTSEDYKDFAEGLDTGKVSKEALDAARWNTKSGNKTDEDDVAMYDLQNNADDNSNDDINAAENAEFDEGGHEYTSSSAQQSMQRAKDLALKLSEQETVSDNDRLELWSAYNTALQDEETAKKEQAKAEEKAAKENAKKQKEWQEHETKVDAYNAERGIETAHTVQQSVEEDIPEDLRVEQSDATAGEIHTAMAKSANFEQLTEAYTKGANSTNENTRVQTVRNLDNLAAMLEKKGVATEEQIQALKHTDAEIYQAGYTGEEISTATTRQKQIYNAGQQAAIKVKAGNNLAQREEMTKQASSISNVGLRDLVTQNYQTGYNTGSYINTLKGIANAQRNGMSFDEAYDTVKMNADSVGADEGAIKAAAQAVFNYSVDLTKAETIAEITKSMNLQSKVKTYGNGIYTDARSDNANAIKGEDVIRRIAKATGFNITVYDDGVENLSNTLRSSQGVFRASNSTIYLNASTANHLASTLYHELGEAISVYAPEEYQAFSKAVQNAVIKKIGINAFNEYREKFLTDYAGEEGKTDVDVDKEMTNDLLYQFLGSEDGMKSFLEELEATSTPEQAQTIKQKLAKWVSDLAEALKKFFAGFEPTAYQRQVADAKIAQMENLAEMLNKSAAVAIKNYQQAKAQSISEEQLDAMFDPNNKEQGELPDDLGFVDNDGTLRFSLATKDTSMKFLQEYLSRQEDLTEAQKQDIINRLEFAAKITQDLAEQQYAYFSTWQKMGLRSTKQGVPLIDIIPKNGDKPLASVAVNNGEYPLNIDFSQICKKRATLNAVINTLVDEYGVLLPTLTESDLNTINKHIKEHGFEIACGLCFVDAKRYRSGKWAESFTGEYSPSMKRKYNRKTKQYDEYYELKKPKNAKVGYNDLVATLSAKDGSEVSASYFDYDTKNKKPNIRTIDQLSEDEIDKSGLLEYFEPYAKYNENGELTGIGGYKDENGKQKNPDEVAKMAYAIYQNKSMRHFLDKNDMMSDAGLDAIRDNNPTLYSLINAHWGAGKPKLNLGGTAYGGEIIRSENWGKNNDFNPEAAKKVGGVRVQSFSDYEANMFFDYCQMFADMEARKLTSHGYTKETDYVRIFGLTGQKINMSIVARGAKLSEELEEAYNRLTKNSNTKLFSDKKYGATFRDIRDNSGINREAVDNWVKSHPESAGMTVSEAARQMLKEGMSVKDILLVEADEKTGINETFNLDDALYYQSADGYKDNCGIIWIGTSNAQIEVLLDADEVPMVIPYHSSGVSGFIKRERNLLLFHDYTKEQNTRFRDGTSITGEDDAADGGKAKKISKGVDFDFYEALYRLNDPKAAADEYLAWCEQHDYIPKFDAFKDHPNYYKLLVDFKVYDYNGVDPEKVATRNYLPQQEVRLNLPENVGEMVKESIAAQEDLIDRRTRELTKGGENLLSDIARDLHLEERAKEEAQVRRGVDDLGLSEESADDRKSINRIPATIEEDIEKNKKEFNDTDPVIDIPSDTFAPGEKRLSEQVKEYLAQNSDNGKIVNGIIGDVDVSSIKADIGHGLGRLKAMTFYAVPETIRNGKIVDYQGNRNGRGYETVVLAAPVRVQNADGEYEEAVVMAVINRKQQSQKFYLHEAYIVNEDESLFKNGMPKRSNSVNDPSSIYNIARALAKNYKNRNSLSENSEGTPLTPEQREYFKDSKAVDENGRLKVMYHGTRHGTFTVFDPLVSRGAMFFTDNKTVANSYGRDRYAVYLNATNPLEVDYAGGYFDDSIRYDGDIDGTYRNFNAAVKATNTGVRADSILKKWIKYNQQNIEDAWRNTTPQVSTGELFELLDIRDVVASEFADADVSNEALEKLYEYADALDMFVQETAFKPYHTYKHTNELLADFKSMIKSGEIQMDTRDWVRYAQMHGYDSVIFRNIVDMGSYRYDGRQSTIIAVFNSNQIKNIDNENPTEDVDIRKSMNLDDTRNMNNEEIASNRDAVASVLEQGKELLKGTKVNKQAVQNIVMEEKRKFGSAIDTAEFTDNLTKLFAYLHNGKSINYNDFVAVMQDVARPAIDQAYTTQASREDFAQFRNAIDGMTFSLTMEQRKAISNAFGSMKVFQRYYPEIHISSDAQSISDQWSTLVDISRGLLDENVDAADMPTSLVDALEALRPSMNNWEDNTQAAHDMALDIISKYLANYHDEGANKAVINEFTKNAEKQIKAKQKEWQSKIKADYNERLKAERAYQKEIAANRVAKANERSAEQIAKLRAKNATRIADIRERQKRNAQLQQINKSASKLYGALVNPTDANHVPKEIQEPVLELMASLDMAQPTIRQGEDGKWHTKILAERVLTDAGRYSYEWQEIVADTREDALRQYNEALQNGLGSQGARKWYDRMQKIADLYNKQDKNRVADENASQDMNEFLQGLSEELAEDFNRIIKKGRESGKASIAELDSEDLKVINTVLKNVQHAINQINKSLTNPSVEISQLAHGTIYHSEVAKGRVNHKKLKLIDSIGDFLMLDNATMETYLHAIGADGLTPVLLQGQDTKARLIREAQEYARSVLESVDPKTVKSWETDVIDYGSIQLTKSQVMSLYELMKREEATSHRAGGFKADADDVNTSYLTDEELNKIVGSLTDEERRVADKLQYFLANNCAAWGNKTSNILVGYDKFGNPRYFPMKVDKASVNMNAGEMLGGLTNSIRNMGMTKAVQENANNALILDSIFDVYAQHVSDMATYSAWAAPVQDLIRFYNYKEIIEEDGFVKRITTKDAIKKLMGKNGTAYFTKMVSSIQNREQSAFVGGGIVEALTGAAKKAAVMGNLRVVWQQPTAIFRAGKMINYKYLNAGMTGANENIRKEMIDSSDVYWLKNQGNIDGYITQSLKSQILGTQSFGNWTDMQSFNDWVSDWTGKLASKADQVTWDAMYRAVITEQIDELGKDKVGTQEFQDAVNKRFENIMLRTQVYDGTITRSQFMRSPDWLNKMQSAFMAEPVKTYNIVLRDAIDLLQADTKDFKAKAVKDLVRSMVVLSIGNTMNAAVQSIWDAVRGAGDPDDEDKDFLTRMLEAFGIDLNAESTEDQIIAFLEGNLVDNVNMLNNIPIISDYADDAFTTIKELATGKSSYGYSNSDLSMSGWEHLGDALKGIIMPGEKQTSYGTFTKIARAFSDLTGYPVYAIQRDMVAMYNTVAHDIAPALGVDGMPVLQKQTKNTKKRQAKLDVYDTIWNSTDLNEVKQAVEEAVEQGNSYKTINADMSENLKEDYISLYHESPSEASKMANRLAEIKAYLSDKEGTLDDKTHSEKVAYYKKKIKDWLD